MSKLSLEKEILSNIIVHNKYAKYIPEKERRETWDEIVTRNKEMHIRKFPELKDEIEKNYELVYNKKILPSMRSLQFSGKPLEINNSRGYNCSFLPIDDYRCFNEVMFLLLSGCGVGYSVQKHHVEQLPEIKIPTKTKRYLIGDSIEGWADAVKMLVKAYMVGGPLPKFDYRDIRVKGANLLTAGGKAPGPEPLKECLFHINKIFERKNNGDKLTTLEVHDIICHIADAVLSGGIRRAALIALFNLDDEEMMSCKVGNWYEKNPQRGRANNTAVIMRHKIDEDEFFKLWGKIRAGGTGEPGIYFSNDKELGTNPSLRAGTQVLTSEGIIPIEELQDKEFKVKNLKGEWQDARCWLSGREKRLWEVTVTGGHKYYCTPEHKWPVWNGTEFERKLTTELFNGNYLPLNMSEELFEGTLGNYNDGLFLGWSLMSGHVNIDGIDDYVKVKAIANAAGGGVYGKLNHILEYWGTQETDYSEAEMNKIEITTRNPFILEKYKTLGCTSMGKLPEAVWKGGSEEFRRGLLDAIFSSDGEFIFDYVRRYIKLVSCNENMINDISKLLGFYGIKTIISYNEVYGETLYTLKIKDVTSLNHFGHIVKMSHIHKHKSYARLYRTLNQQHFSQNKIEIIGCKPTDIYEDVWDISVNDDTHCFQLAHCVTGNCGEISLRPYQFCNLVEINVSDIENQEDLNNRSKAAAFIGTLQASYTDFHYLRDIWKKTTEKEALIGVGQTGIASENMSKMNLKEAAKKVVEENTRISKIIGINSAARCTTVKPSGTSSLVLGTSSGIHAWFAPYYIRRVRVGKNEALYTYLSIYHPELLEDCFFKPNIEAIISIPQKAPEGAIIRTESPIDLLNRVKRYNTEWIKYGHIKGPNTNNVSVTVSIKDNEWEEVGKWMWENNKAYNGISVLPYDGANYIQPPYEEITKEKYDDMMKHLKSIDLTKVIEVADGTNLMENLACSGGNCEIS